MKKALFILSFLILFLGALYLFFGRNEPLIKYKSDKITRGNIVATVTASGTVNAVTTVLVGTQVSGTIKNIFVDFNSQVSKGQLIARIDPASFDSQVEQARANLLSAKANLEKSEAVLLDSNRVYERNESLYQKNLIARSDLESSETNALSAKAQVSAAKAQIAQANAALTYAETNLKYTRIVSPVDGIVVSRNVDIGQTVAASFQTPTLFNIAQDLTKMQIDTSVSEADIGKVKVLQPVEFSVDAYPDVIFKGSVYEIRNAPVIVQNVVTYDVVVKVDNSELKLKPGMTANVSVITSSKKGVLRISNAALRFSPPEFRKGSGDGSATAWILDQEKPKRIRISTGISDGNFTELVSGEILEGQEVLVDVLSKTKKQQTPSGPRMF
jgi:HlyD family secretion protein